MRKALLALALAGSLAAGQPTLLDQLWSLLTAVWSAPDPEAGCGFDPDGSCSPAPRSKEGCGFDPDGRCDPTPRTDEGCGFDPNGGPCGS